MFMSRIHQKLGSHGGVEDSGNQFGAADGMEKKVTAWFLRKRFIQSQPRHGSSIMNFTDGRSVSRPQGNQLASPTGYLMQIAVLIGR